MRVTFLGTGSAMPHPDRAQTGLLFEEGDRTVLVDCGAGVLGRLSRTDVGYEDVSTVLLTHHHLDHVNDLLALLKARWLAGEEHLEVVGPRGTRRLVSQWLDVFEYLDGRVDLQVRDVAPGSFAVGGFEVTARETRHSTVGLAYRIAGEKGDFVFSGDTEAFEELATFGAGTSIFAHDCSFPDDVDVSNHPTPTQLGRAIAGHDVGDVYLTHCYPHTDGREEEMIAAVRAHYDGPVRVAHDGLTVDVGAE
jgi:ribonuclease BN (tRNA processing enzyme)